MATKEELITQYGNEARTYFYLRELKWTHKGTCAVMGNINQESGFSTTAISFDGYGSLGICQWTGGRRTNLENFLKARGFTNDSLEGQCAFLDFETKKGYVDLYKSLTQDTTYTLKELTDKFCREWERPAEAYANYPRRESSAQTYYDRYNGAYDGASFGNLSLAASTVLSADNYDYVEQEEEEQNTLTSGQSTVQAFKDAIANVSFSAVSSAVKNAAEMIENIVEQANVGFPNKPTEYSFKDEVHGATLPVYPTFVQAPFGEITLGGVSFGTYNVYKQYKSYPNYVQSIEITKTNGTINEYTIRLIHQIALGDNPNYIAELLSATGYNKIKIAYGDANSRKYFIDVDALLIGVSTSFDFANCNITYTLRATSLSYLTATTRLNFPATTDKPSNVILDLLKNQEQLITDYFTGMRDMTAVMELGLIPTNDKKVEIDAVKDKTVLEYISYLVSLMQDEVVEIADKSTYYLVVNDDNYNDMGNTFSIHEVISDNIIPDSLVYEVDVGYPDNNLVYDFSVSTDYAWSIAYSDAQKITDYKYEINDIGDLLKKSSSVLLPTTLSNNDFTIDSNMWKQLTRFPISANLTVKGLMAPIPLMTYIRVNNYYFGNRRITSGLYILTEQKDTINGNGCVTVLGLTRVASDVESIGIDGRVRT